MAKDSDKDVKPGAKKGDDKSAKEKSGKEKKEEKKPAEPPKPPPTPLEVLHRNIFLLDKYVDTHDARFLARVLRYTNFVRAYIPLSELRSAVETHVLDGARRGRLVELLAVVGAHRKEPEVIVPPAPAPAASATAAASGSPAPAAAAAAAAAATASGSADIEMKDDTKPNGTPAGSGAAAPAKATDKDTAAVAAAAASAAPKPPKPSTAAAAEVDAYLTLLAVSILVHCEAPKPSQAVNDAISSTCAELIPHISVFNRRTLDVFLARAYEYLALVAEREARAAAGAAGAGASRLEALRPQLVAAHRTASLRHDEYGQAVTLNLLLRNFVQHHLYDQAAKLLSKTTFPEAASNAQLVRYSYYKGRILAVQLNYSEALAALNQAVRKAPATALAFRTRVQKVAIIVQLLTGEVPERSLFTSAEMAAALRPYFELTRAVRQGNLPSFAAVSAKYAQRFALDDTATLIARLEANVIKAGLRKIATSYSRISFADIATKLQLGGAADAEFLCAKAIRDGVIDGELDHEARALTSREIANVYATKEPQEAFHRRIEFCLDVHNQAVRSMRYPPGAGRKDLETAEMIKQREEEENEFANMLEKGEEPDMEDEGDM